MRGRVVCLDPYELALRGFVWKLGPFYSGGVFDKDQRLKCIIGKMVIIGSRFRDGGSPTKSPTQWSGFLWFRA